MFSGEMPAKRKVGPCALELTLKRVFVDVSRVWYGTGFEGVRVCYLLLDPSCTLLGIGGPRSRIALYGQMNVLDQLVVRQALQLPSQIFPSWHIALVELTFLEQRVEHSRWRMIRQVLQEAAIAGVQLVSFIFKPVPRQADLLHERARLRRLAFVGRQHETVNVWWQAVSDG